MKWRGLQCALAKFGGCDNACFSKGRGNFPSKTLSSIELFDYRIIMSISNIKNLKEMENFYNFTIQLQLKYQKFTRNFIKYLQKYKFWFICNWMPSFCTNIKNEKYCLSSKQIFITQFSRENVSFYNKAKLQNCQQMVLIITIMMENK